MKKITIVFNFCAIYLFWLFFSKSIFYSILLGLIFSLVYILSIVIWDKQKDLVLKFILKPFINIFVGCLLTFSFIVLFYTTTVFWLTEISMKTPRVSDSIGIAFSLIFLLVFNTVNWQNKVKSKKIYFILFIFVVFNLLLLLTLNLEKRKMLSLPKIYKITPSWSIQGQVVKIEGLNFGPAWQPGKVMFDNYEMTIKQWNENFIVFEQPVLGDFSRSKIHVIRNDQVYSNGYPFEIKDPKFLININNYE